jgi:hypothetical protein
MKPRLPFAMTAITPIMAIALMLMAPALRAGTLDRIAVTVGRYVISERDIIQDIRISAFLDGKLLDGTAPSFSGPQKHKAAERLVDQYLLLQDAVLTRVALASPADAAPLLAPIKARYASDGEYWAALAQAQITDAELTNHLLAGLRMLRYTDLRFRPEVQLSEENLRTFYDTLAGLGDPNIPIEAHSFEESRDAIEKLLTDQQVMQSLDRWLSMTRGETQIVYRDAVFLDEVSP